MTMLYVGKNDIYEDNMEFRFIKSKDIKDKYTIHFEEKGNSI